MKDKLTHWKDLNLDFGVQTESDQKVDILIFLTIRTQKPIPISFNFLDEFKF